MCGGAWSVGDDRSDRDRIEPISETVRRQALADLDRAIISLSLIDNDPSAMVRRARRRTKRVRVGVRLLRSQDKRRFRDEDRILAQAVRNLGPVRDRQVAHHLIGNLGRWPGNMVPPPMAPSVRISVAHSGMILNGVRGRAGSWEISSLDDEAITAELERCYRLARRQWRSAMDDVEADGLAGCRKAVQRAADQARITAPQLRTSERFVALTGLAKHLGNLLDLAPLPDSDHSRQPELERNILDLGHEVFSLKPEEHLRWLAGPD
ncbi:MAG: hypothetical protein ACI8TP_002217 [Acidimicrobiales bacterium]|jgi:hypothetical protein